MFEPVAAAILNSLPGRPPLSSLNTLQSIKRGMTAASGRQARSTLFRPFPRSAKGKERADTSGSSCSTHLTECQEWSCCSNKHSVFCPTVNQWLSSDELAPHRIRTRKRCPRPRLPNSCAQSIQSLNQLAKPVRGVQIRHASRMPQRVQSLPSPSSWAASSHSSQPPAPSIIATADAVDRFRELSRLRTGSLSLQEGWDAYGEVSNLGTPSSIQQEDILRFVHAMTDSLETSYLSEPQHLVDQWGHRLITILDNIDTTSPHPRSPLNDSRLRLLARLNALMDDLPKAKSLLQSTHPQTTTHGPIPELLRVYETVILAIWKSRGYDSVIDFVVSQWEHLGSHLLRYTRGGKDGSLEIRSLRECVFRSFGDMQHPSAVLASRSSWPEADLLHVAELLANFIVDRGSPQDALALLSEMDRQDLHPPVKLKLAFVRFLAKKGALRDARALFDAVEKRLEFKSRLSTGLYLSAREGNIKAAQAHFADLQVRGWETDGDKALLLFAHASLAQLDECVQLFDQFFPLDGQGRRQNSPKLKHFTNLIQASSSRGDIQQLNLWLAAMTEAGFRPDAHIYTTVLKGFAKTGDLDAVKAIMVQMRAAGVRPNTATYTVVITLLAHHKDSIGAESVYKHALDEGIIPDRHMVTSVMNAHVEAGSWLGVIRIFDYLKSAPSRNLRLSIEVYNTLLKAYVMIGAPFNIVSNIYGKMEASKVRPDAYTYAMLIQSACDSELMDVATEIFEEMDQKAGERADNPQVNVYVFTIIMAGFLRIGDKLRAQGVFEEMRSRGIKPTPVTVAAILRAFGDDNSNESMITAENFVDSLLEDPEQSIMWDIQKGGSKSAVQQIFAPLISGYGKLKNMEEAERLFQKLLDTGEKPSIGILTHLLDGYRRIFDIETVQRLWPQIFELGKQRAQDAPFFDDDESGILKPTPHKLRRKVLSVPLSIYIDALSAAGLHADIAAIWKQFIHDGLSFDSHNWNHLAVTLVRAGKVDRAFEILERIILPRQWQSERSTYIADTRAGSPFQGTQSYQTDDVMVSPPLRSPKPRAKVVELAKKRPAITTLSNSDDPAYALDVLHQIPPSWNLWRPHTATLSMLLQALNRLEGGYLILPYNPQNDDLALDARANPKEARALLEKICAECPDAVREVYNFELSEQRRLGRNYGKAYMWE